MLTTHAGKFLNAFLTVPPLPFMSVVRDEVHDPAGWIITSTKLVLLGTSFEYFCGVPEVAWVLSDINIPATTETVTASPMSHNRACARFVFFDLLFRIMCFRVLP